MPLSGIEQNGAPLANQIEICLFGKGFGECIIIHLGNNKWVVIDSFLHPKTQRPIAFEYLESLAIDVSQHVCLVIATHWHDDHIRGISNIIEAAHAARAVFSQAVREDEFKKFVKRYQTKLMTASGTKVDEMNRVLDFFNNKPTTHSFPRPRLASQSRTLHEFSQAELNFPLDCKVEALSPSDSDIWDFMQTVAQMIPQSQKTKRPARRPTQNHVCVVTRLDYGDMSILLGADMENQAGNDRGWNAILSAPNSPIATVYKVAHHGSITGHNDGVWQRLLAQAPLAIVTPFINGHVKLPTREQINTILSKTPNLFATGLPAETKAKKRSAAVEKEIRNVKMRSIGAGLGAIRLRSKPITQNSSECVWSVELFGQAQHLLAA